MSKESLNTIDNNWILYEPLISEFNTRKLGVPSNIDYSLGQATFDGSSSKILYPIRHGIKSVRLKLQLTTTTENILKLSSTHNIVVSGGTITANGFSSPTIYVNGIATSTITTSKSEIIITTATAFVADDIQLGFVTSYLDGVVDLFGLNINELTSSEISNLYENKTYHELPDVIDENTYKILDVSAFGGVLEEKMGNTLTPTDVDIKKVGSNIYSPDFNGSTSKIDAGNFNDLTGDITILAWVNPKTAGENDNGFILFNGKFYFTFASVGRIQFSSNIITYWTSSNNAVPYNKNSFVAITRTSVGLIEVSVNGIVIVTGQDTGVPVAGTETIKIGNNNTGTRAVDGKIPREVIYKGLLSTEQITQFWTNTRRYYE